ncbi:MAG: FxLYD domain-containing protein [Chloroflexota bacterium]
MPGVYSEWLCQAAAVCRLVAPALDKERKVSRRALAIRVWLILLPSALLAGVLTGCDARPAPTPFGSPTATQTPLLPTPTRVLALGMVAGTGGDGVYMRWLPSNNPEDRMREWAEGTKLEVVGDDLRAGGRVWKKVKDPAGDVGWVPAEFVITATPTRTPSVTLTPTPTVAPTQTATFTPAPTDLPTVQPTAVPTATSAPTAAPAPQPTKTSVSTPTAVPTQAPPSAPTAVPMSYNLDLYATTESKSVAYVTIEGYVRNVGDSTLENVQVVVQYYSSTGQALSHGSAGIVNSALGLGQSAYFKVLVEARPDMARFTVGFLDSDGRPIPTHDSR